MRSALIPYDRGLEPSIAKWNAPGPHEKRKGESTNQATEGMLQPSEKDENADHDQNGPDQQAPIGH